MDFIMMLNDTIQDCTKHWCPNHWIMHQEVATVTKDDGHEVDEAEVVCNQTTIDVYGTPTSSIECILETEYTFPSWMYGLVLGIKGIEIYDNYLVVWVFDF